MAPGSNVPSQCARDLSLDSPRRSARGRKFSSNLCERALPIVLTAKAKCAAVDGEACRKAFHRRVRESRTRRSEELQNVTHPINRECHRALVHITEVKRQLAGEFVEKLGLSSTPERLATHLAFISHLAHQLLFIRIGGVLIERQRIAADREPRSQLAAPLGLLENALQLRVREGIASQGGVHELSEIGHGSSPFGCSQAREVSQRCAAKRILRRGFELLRLCV